MEEGKWTITGLRHRPGPPPGPGTGFFFSGCVVSTVACFSHTWEKKKSLFHAVTVLEYTQGMSTNMLWKITLSCQNQSLFPINNRLMMNVHSWRESFLSKVLKWEQIKQLRGESWDKPVHCVPLRYRSMPCRLILPHYTPSSNIQYTYYFPESASALWDSELALSTVDDWWLKTVWCLILNQLLRPHLSEVV